MSVEVEEYLPWLCICFSRIYRSKHSSIFGGMSAYFVAVVIERAVG